MSEPTPILDRTWVKGSIDEFWLESTLGYYADQMHVLVRAHAGQPFVVEERDLGGVWGIVGFGTRWSDKAIVEATLEALLERIALELMVHDH